MKDTKIALTISGRFKRAVLRTIVIIPLALGTASFHKADTRTAFEKARDGVVTFLKDLGGTTDLSHTSGETGVQKQSKFTRKYVGDKIMDILSLIRPVVNGPPAP